MSQSGAIGLDGLRARSAVGALAPITIFLGAFLLFAVEPLIAKMILPWFGGSAEVWIVCLLFFQTALLAGYLYAHCVSYLKPPWRLRLHILALAASLLFLPIIPSDAWKPAGGETPLFHILGVLASTIGLPFVLLAANGPLVQHWLSPTQTAENAMLLTAVRILISGNSFCCASSRVGAAARKVKMMIAANEPMRILGLPIGVVMATMRFLSCPNAKSETRDL